MLPTASGVLRGTGDAISAVSILFLLRGALAFAGSRVPAWVAPAVLVMAAVRAGLWWSGRHEATWLLNWLCEGPLAIWAAVAVVRIPDRAEVSINERILPWALGTLAGLTMIDPLVRGVGP